MQNRSTNPWLILILLILAGAGFSPSSSAADPLEEDEPQDDADGFFRSIELGLEADLELIYEKQGSETAGEVTLDEVAVTLDGDWWEAEVGIKYETEGDKGIIVEESAVRIGGTDEWPWFVQVGRTVIPFGEYDSQFIEDPMVLILGEIDDEAVVLGIETGRLEIAAGAFRGQRNQDGNLDGAASVRARLAEGWVAGVSWTSDLGESVEMRDWHREYLAAYGQPPQPDESRVQGLAWISSFQVGRSFGRLGYLTALQPVAAGILTTEDTQPSAWSLETGLVFAENWILAARWEAAQELPGAPDQQFGLALTHELAEPVTVTAEYLRGIFEGTIPDRDLFGLMVSFVF